MNWDGRNAGSRSDYDQADRQALIAYMKVNCTGAANAITLKQLSDALMMGGRERAMRQIISDIDGVEFVLGTGDGGQWIAEFYEEAEPGTARLGSQARTMQERVDRRRAFANQRLRRRQGTLTDQG